MCRLGSFYRLASHLLPMRIARDSRSVPINSALERSMYWFNWIGLLTLIAGSMMGCAQRGAYLGSGSNMMPAVIDSTAPLVTDGACQRCGEMATCRCRVFPGARLLRCLTCGAGCGDVYWGEWTSDPPEACDGCIAYPSPPFSLSGGRVSTANGSTGVVGEEAVVRASYATEPQPLWNTHTWARSH